MRKLKESYITRTFDIEVYKLVVYNKEEKEESVIEVNVLSGSNPDMHIDKKYAILESSMIGSTVQKRRMLKSSFILNSEEV